MTIAGQLFTRVGTTTFYQPDEPRPGERLWFLRWSADSPPARIGLSEMWREEGTHSDDGNFVFVEVLLAQCTEADTPPDVGYFVFFVFLPAHSTAPDVERALRAAWTVPPNATSFAWVKTHGPIVHTDLSISTRLALTLDASNRPIVEADTVLT